MAEESISKPQDKLVEMIQSEEQREKINEKNFKAEPGDFCGGSAIKNQPANTGDTGLIRAQEDSSCWGQLSLTVEAQSPCSAAREVTSTRSLCSTTRS